MKTLLEDLTDWGCDVKGAMERVVDDVELYHTCLDMFKDDPAFDALGKAIADGDAKAGFDQAHTIKGVAANLGLTPIWQDVFPVVETFRKGETAGASAGYARLCETLKTYRELMARHAGED